MKTQLPASLLLAAIATVVLSAPVLAQPEIIPTNCDTLSLDPPLVRVEFDVVNPWSHSICSIFVSPIAYRYGPADSCRILECDPPSLWNCWSLDGLGIWEGQLIPPVGEIECVDQGEQAGPFSMVFDTSVSCCFDVQFYEAAALNRFYSYTLCLLCDQPVQALSGTWGELKAIYR